MPSWPLECHLQITKLFFVNGIIEPIIIPHFPQYTPNYQFMDDNAAAHGARIVKTGPQEVGVLHMVWPISPDLNPTENIWDQLKQRQEDVTSP